MRVDTRVRPVAVYRENSTWRWVCRVPGCCQSGWSSWGHRGAMDDAHRHIKEHATFGFTGRG